MAEPRPAIVFAHGLVPPGARPTPRDWPVYRGYGSVAAARGAVGVVVDHRLHGLTGYPDAADDLAAAVELARQDSRVDAERVAIWAFSGAGLLLADWLRAPPAWLRCVAASYPILGGPPGLDPRFQPAEAVAHAGALPIVLTRVGREHPQIAATVEAFVSAARACDARLEIVDVPHGQHGFDVLDHTDESRAAVERALTAVTGHI
ncbi:alpha/beta hydrolase [Phytohabitans aurantiacus]|uniref:alpha/beta hydrolase n=1 Tax=Phytohabitans aurantiacus TaxID=3016789 RepID=UPI0024924480|nr:dienelactone hydrolase family protein [Phytohabitans aurantiacus]